MAVVLNCKKFQVSSNAVQLAVIKAVCNICFKRLFDEDYSRELKRFCETNDATFYKNRYVITSILEEVIPAICKIKLVKRKQSEAATTALVVKASKRKAAQYKGKLADVIPENAVPMMPQLAPDSRRQPNFIPTKPQPPATKKPTDKPPGLTE